MPVAYFSFSRLLDYSRYILAGPGNIILPRQCRLRRVLGISLPLCLASVWKSKLIRYIRCFNDYAEVSFRYPNVLWVIKQAVEPCWDQAVRSMASDEDHDVVSGEEKDEVSSSLSSWLFLIAYIFSGEFYTVFWLQFFLCTSWQTFAFSFFLPACLFATIYRYWPSTNLCSPAHYMYRDRINVK
jgi:hypothetical protein